MNNFAVSMMLLGLGLTLVLSAISVFAYRGPVIAGGTKPWTRFFLVALRLSIGWHFFVEGLEKFNTPTWSSEPYLREATGPLAPLYRRLAGDRLIDKLKLGDDGSFPAALDADWRGYLGTFTSFYELDAQQAEQAKKIAEAAKLITTNWFDKLPYTVEKASEYPPPFMVSMTMPERLKEYKDLQAKVYEIEDVQIPKYGSEAFADLKKAKANLNKWRAELKRDLDKQTLIFKEALRDGVLLPIAKQALPPEYQAKVNLKNSPRTTTTENAKVTATDPIPVLRTIHQELLLKQGDAIKLTSQAKKVFAYAIDSQKGTRDFTDPVPASALGHSSLPVSSWSRLDWSDALVKWGVLLTGICLLLGVLTRTACIAGAVLLLMFFLAMPPLPGWPESPKAEGHYLFINKNIIEMFALLALATTRSGRWVGIDGVLQFLRPKSWRDGDRSDNVDKAVSLGEAPTVAIK